MHPRRRQQVLQKLNTKAQACCFSAFNTRTVNSSWAASLAQKALPTWLCRRVVTSLMGYTTRLRVAGLNVTSRGSCSAPLKGARFTYSLPAAVCTEQLSTQPVKLSMTHWAVQVRAAACEQVVCFRNESMRRHKARLNVRGSRPGNWNAPTHSAGTWSHHGSARDMRPTVLMISRPSFRRSNLLA